MSTTTFNLIRSQFTVLMESLIPTSNTGVRFRRHRDEKDFFDWCGENKSASWRRFEVRGGMSYEGPEITNTDLEFHRMPASVTVAYPLEWGKYGGSNRASLEKVVEEDMHAIDDTLGLRGLAGWVSGSWSRKVRDEVAEQDGVLYMKMDFEIGLYRSV